MHLGVGSFLCLTPRELRLEQLVEIFWHLIATATVAPRHIEPMRCHCHVHLAPVSLEDGTAAAKTGTLRSWDECDLGDEVLNLLRVVNRDRVITRIESNAGYIGE